MEYVYQIKLAVDVHNQSRPILMQGIVRAKTKREVLNYLQDEYPEYFEGNKISQRLSKDSDQLVYVTVHPLTSYWADYWLSEAECVVCHKKVPLIQIKKYLGDIDIRRYTCSAECKRKYEENSNVYDTVALYQEKCKYYYIYKITNKINNKVYVGYTAREPIFRWWEHSKTKTTPLGKDFEEYGIECFTFEVLERRLKQYTSLDEIKRLETNYILLYDSINNGYNIIVSNAQGGDTDVV